MRDGRGFILIVATLIFSICRASLLEYTSQIPACGLPCLLQAIPVSACRTFTNDTCICTDPDLLATVAQCASNKCAVLDMMKFAKIQEQACDRPERRRSMVDQVVFVAVDIFTFVCIIVRMGVRYNVSSRLEMDDWVVVVMVMVWAVFLGLGHYIRTVAMGRDIWDVNPETLTRVLRLTFIDELLYTLVLSLCRIAVVMFLLRVFSVPRFCTIGWAVIGWIVLYTVGVLFATVFQCIPVEYNWVGWTGQFAGPHRCIDVNALSFAAAGIGIAQDLTIMVLPLPVIASLNMALRKRIQTVFMFSLGIFVVITSCIRLRHLVHFETSNNPTWDNVDAIIWTHAEVSVSVIVVCLPAIRVALASVAPRLFGSSAARTPASASASGGSKAMMPFSKGSGGASRARVHREWYEDRREEDIELTSGQSLIQLVDSRVDAVHHHHHHYHRNESSDVILGSDSVVAFDEGKEEGKLPFRKPSRLRGSR